jgi:subtilase family serine protease
MLRRRLISALLLLCAAGTLHAQPDRITAPVDAARVVALDGNLRPPMLLQNDGGSVDGSFPLPAMILFLRPSSSQQADLRQLLEDQQNPGSPLYRHWLTPEEFADRFGDSPNDIAALTGWLQAQGFTVARVARARTRIVFSGTARQVEDVFHAEIHHYAFAGKSHFANAAEPSIPAALSELVGGIDGLDDFAPDQPEMTTPNGTHLLAPDDVATIYDIMPVYQSGIDGTGQKLVVVGTTEFNASALADVAAFRAQFNLPPNVPEVMLAAGYPDPGVNSNSINEAHLDVEWSGAIARNAQVIFVYAITFLEAIEYAVDSNLAPVITASFNNGCEAVNSASNMNFYRSLAQQANAQGITWVNSGGDSGPAACDGNGAAIAMGGLAVRFPASIPEVTAVGGSEFNEQLVAYWAPTNTVNSASALSHIPEMVWNDALALGALWAGGGGASIHFPKPAWQTGPGVPNDNARDMPDVVMAASFSHDGYYVIRNGVSVTTGGTSAAAPVFAGILTLLNQYVVNNGIQKQPGLGNVNPMLYRLALPLTGVFHDITVGNNIVPCVNGTPDCSNGSMGFSAGPGYDLASGLGSVDVANLLNCQEAARYIAVLDPSGRRPHQPTPGPTDSDVRCAVVR